MKAIRDFESKRRPHSLEDLDEYRMLTTGDSSKLLARLANEIHSIPREKAEVIEEAVHHWGMAVQYLDDFSDFLYDIRNNDPNYVQAILREN